MTIARQRLQAALWLLGLVVVALLPDPGAALPQWTYYFRDISLTFLPLRQYQASELVAGRLPFWNPYVHEGEFMLPSFYPLDLLHVLDSSPEFVSWLLTLHLPLAALGRTRGMSQLGAFVCGTVYSIGGFALSTLNLYVFLQAFALAPFVVLTFERTATRGGCWIAGARDQPDDGGGGNRRAGRCGGGAARHLARRAHRRSYARATCYGDTAWLRRWFWAFVLRASRWPSCLGCCRKPSAARAYPPTKPRAWRSRRWRCLSSISRQRCLPGAARTGLPKAADGAFFPQ